MNGYIQADILGKVRGLKFGMLAAQQIFTQANRLNKSLGAEVDAALVPVVIYWGLFNNCYVKQEDPDFTFEQVCDWVDANLDKAELYQSIFQAFYSSTVIAGAVEQEKKTELKGKKTGTKQGR